MLIIEEGISKVLAYPNIKKITGHFVQERARETAAKELISGEDVMAILPTGYYIRASLW